MNSPIMPSFGNFKKIVAPEEVKESVEDIKPEISAGKKHQEGIKRKDKKKHKEIAFTALGDGMKRSRQKKHGSKGDDRQNVEDVMRSRREESHNTKRGDSLVQPHHKTLSSPHSDHHIYTEEASRSSEDFRMGAVQTPKIDLSFKSSTSPFHVRRMPDHSYVQHGGIHKQDLPDYDQDYKGIVGLEGRTKGGPTILWSRDQRSFSILGSPLLSHPKAPVGSLGYYESLVEALYDEKTRVQNKTDSAPPPRTSTHLYSHSPTSSSAIRPLFGVQSLTAPSSSPSAKKPIVGSHADILFGSPEIPIDKAVKNNLRATDEEEDAWEKLEAKFLSETKRLNLLVTQRPHRTSAWMDLVHLQDQFSDVIYGRSRGRGGERNLKILYEKKLGILHKALLANPHHQPLLIYKLNLMSLYESATEAKEAWISEILKNPCSFPLWHSYLHFIQTNFSVFSLNYFRATSSSAIRYLNREKPIILTTSKKTNLSTLQYELSLAKLFILVATIEYQSGYVERALALFQALIEINFFAPEHLTRPFHTSSSSLSSSDLVAARYTLLAHFRLFWEAKIPKYGQKEAKGWKTHVSLLPSLLPSSTPYNPLLDISEDVCDLKHLSSSKSSIVSPHGHQTASPVLPSLPTPTSTCDNDIHHIYVPFQSPISSWANEERRKDEISIFPVSPDHMLDDPNSVVLFEDIKDYLIYFEQEEAKKEVLEAYFRLFGGISFQRPFSTNSALYQAHLLGSENPDDIFYLVNKANYPPMLSVAQKDEFYSNQASLPPLDDFLDFHLDSKSYSEARIDLMKVSLEQINCEGVNGEIRDNAKKALIFLGGESSAKSLLQHDQSNLNLWNAYLFQLASTEMNPKKLNFFRKTYSKIIPTFTYHPSIIHTIRHCSLQEYRLDEVEKCLDILYSLIPPSLLSSAAPRSLLARNDFNQRLKAFEAGIEAMMQQHPGLPTKYIPGLLESIEIYFSLVVVCALLDRIVGHHGEDERRFMEAKRWATRVFRLQRSSTGTWLVERWKMYEVGIMTLDYENGKRKRVVGRTKLKDLKVVLEKAIFEFPSNHYLLSLFLCLSIQHQIYSYHRIFFSKMLSRPLAEKEELLSSVEIYEDLLQENEAQMMEEEANIGEVIEEEGASRQKSKMLLYLFNARSECFLGSYPSVKRTLERCVEGEEVGKQAIIVWKVFLEVEMARLFHRLPSSPPSSALQLAKSIKDLLFRAIQECPWAKSLWLDFLQPLAPFLSPQDVSLLGSLFESKEIRFRDKMPPADK